MRSVHRRGTLGTALALVLALTAGACDVITERTAAATLRVGYDTRDGSLEVWPPRGDLSGDPQAVTRLTKAVAAWRTPTDDRVHLPSSGVLWLGTVDGVPLALVAANVPGGAASWLLQLSDHGAGFTIDRAGEYTDPGYLVYSDILPVHVPSGRRYLTSSRVQRLLGPDGAEVGVRDGLSEPVAVPRCTAVTVTVSLRATESLPGGRADERLVDLGTAIEDPQYPLVRDASGSGTAALDGLDTCALAGPTGPFGSIPSRDFFGDVIDGVPVSWPLDRISTRPLGEVCVGPHPPARLDQLRWRAATGSMSAVVYRSPAGPVVLSRATRGTPLGAYLLPVAGQPLVVLVWEPDAEAVLSLPPRVVPLVEQPGLVVLPKPERRQTYTLTTPHKSYHRTVTDRGDIESAESD